MYKLRSFYIITIVLCLLSSCSASKLAQRKADSVDKTNIPAPTEVTEVSTVVEYHAPIFTDDKKDDKHKEYQQSKKREHDLIHTKLAVSFDWAKQYVLGEANLILSPFFYSTQTLKIDAKGFDIHQVALINDKKRVPLEYTYDDLQLNIQLDRIYSRDEQFEVFVKYTAKPNEIRDKFPEITEDNIGLYFIDPLDENPLKPTQLWTQGEMEASSCWFPTIDSPNERTSQEIAITVDEKYTTLSNGKFVKSTKNDNNTRTDYWKQEKGHAPYLFMMAVGEFAVVKDKWRDIEVNYYVEKEYEPYAKSIFGNTPEMLDFFSDLLQYDYPWDKYSQIVVRDFVAGAMENTTAVTFFEDMHMTDEELLDNNHEDIIAHELAHHWFGDLVTCESWANLALNESFATYSEYLWIAHKYGRDEADYHLSKDLTSYLGEANYKQEPIIRFHYRNRDDMFDRHTYQKGGRVLHMLRNYIGDEAFFIAITNYLNDREYNSAEIHDLRLAFEETCGEDLNWFFNQWFMTAGHPELEINYDFNKAKNNIRVSVFQKQTEKGTALFRLPMAVDVYQANGKKERHHIIVEDTISTFVFAASQEPKLVNVDAEKMVLCRKKDNKSVASFINQYRLAPLFLDRYEAILSLYKKQEDIEVQKVLLEAMQDSSWIVRREAISMIRLDNETTKGEAIRILKEIAENDKKSQVRAMAVTKLRGLRDKAFLPIFEKGIQDPSFLVKNISLLGLSDLNDEATLKAAMQLDKSNNPTLINRIARIYAELGTAKHQTFFEERLNVQSRFSQYAIMENYVEYMQRLDNPKVEEKGLKTLERLALKSNNRWLRLNATKSIGMLRDSYSSRKKKLSLNTEVTASDNNVIQEIDLRINELNEVLNHIKSNEMDESLIEFYQGM